MDNYLAELAKSRGQLLEAMMNTNWSYTGRADKIRTIQEEIAKIDAMIDKVIEPPEATGVGNITVSPSEHRGLAGASSGQLKAGDK